MENSNSETIDASIFEEEGAITPEIISSKSVPSVPSVTSTYSSDVAKILIGGLNINENNLFHESSCKICRSPYRQEIEQKWIETKKHSEVKSLYEQKEKKKLDDTTIDNHVSFHLDAGVRELKKIEYIHRIQRLTSGDTFLTTLDRIKLDLAIIDDRLLGINSLTPNSETSAAEVEKIQADATVKLINAQKGLLTIKASIEGEMRLNGDLVTINRELFLNICLEAHASAPTEEARSSIMSLLKALKDHMKNG